MPITPLHFGPGLLLKATAPNHFSWCAFAAANVLIDIEPAAYWILEGEPHHRFLHTYLGATIAGVVAAAISLKLLPAWLRWWNRQMSPAQARYLGVNAEVRATSVLCGALLGGWSHVILDSIMHHDVAPFSPFSLGNALVAWVSVDQLYLGCLLSGVAGALVMAARRISRRHRTSVEPEQPPEPDLSSLPRMFLCITEGVTPEICYRVIANPDYPHVAPYATSSFASEEEAWAQVNRDFRHGG